MSSIEKTYTNVVFERQGATNHCYTVVASGLASKAEADELAQRLSSENLGTLYFPGRLYRPAGVRESELLKLLNQWKVVAGDNVWYEG